MRDTLPTLRRIIARLEDRPHPLPGPSSGANQTLTSRASSNRLETENCFENKAGTKNSFPLAFGLDLLDRLFAGHGLAGNALHEIHAPEARAVGAATGFLTGLLVRLAQSESGGGDAPSPRIGTGLHKPVLWVQDPSSAREAGRLHGPGLHAFGLDPRRVIVLKARSVAETLWAMEEGLSCPGLGAIVGDIRGPSKALDLTATRRLALRAEKIRRPVLFLKTSAPEEASAARSRWRIAPAPSMPPSTPLDAFQNGIGRAAWRLDLTKNRDGPTGHWTLEWNHHDQSFSLAAAHPGALAAAPADRPAGAPRMGTLVALRGAG